MGNRFTLFGEYLRSARESFKLTQDQLAKKIGVSTQTISNWECGQCLPPRNKVSPIARIFHISDVDVQKVRAQATFEKYRSAFESQGTFLMPDPAMDSDEDYEKMLGTPPWKANFIPLLDCQTKETADVFIKKPQQWKGEWLGISLIPARMFAFRILDKAMEPEFRQGSIIVCDSQRPLTQASCKVLVKIKNTPPLFRIYLREKDKIALKPINTDFPTQVIKPKNIEWVYPVVKAILDID